MSRGDGEGQEVPEAEALEMPARFDDFVVSVSGSLMRLAFVRTDSLADAEDLVQDALAAAHRRWDVVGQYDDPASWVRRVVFLLWFEDLPVSEVAAVLRCGEETVRAHWRRARMKLAEQLGEGDDLEEERWP